MTVKKRDKVPNSPKTSFEMRPTRSPTLAQMMIVQPPKFFRPVARSYRLFRRDSSGNLETTIVRISEPYEGDGMWHADVEILPIQPEPFVMCGVDAEQALELSDSFVASLAGAKGWARDDR